METSALVKALEVYLQVSYDLLEAYTTYYWNKVDNWKHIPQNSDNYCIFTEVWPCWLLHQNQLIALVIAYHYRNLGTVLLKKSNWSNSCFQKVFYNSTLLCTICFQRTVSNPDETQKWVGGGGNLIVPIPLSILIILSFYTFVLAPLDLRLVVLSSSNSGSHKCLFYRIMSLISTLF